MPSLGLGMGIGMGTRRGGTPDPYGPEEVANGGFDDATGWSLPANAAISGGTLNITGTGNTFRAPVSGTLNGTYRVVFTVTEVTGAGNQVRFTTVGAVTNSGVFRNAPGTYEETFTFNNVTSLRMSAGTTTNCKVDNLSVRQVL